MAETFNCPKCGAPVNYDPETHQTNIPCPYCGESVIVPQELRTPQPIIQLVDRRPRDNSAGKFVLGCIGLSVALTIGIILIVVTAFNRAQDTSSDMVNQLVTEVMPTLIAMPTDMAERAPTAAPEIESTPTPETSPTPDLMATATDIARKAEQWTTLASQQAWPVVLDEKFADASREWTVGSDNNDMAVEEHTIADHKYTWKMTAKQGMASLSYPTMDDQTDMYVSVDLQMDAPNGAMDQQAGISFRQTPNDSTFYFFSVNADGYYSLSMYDGNGWIDLIPTTETDLLRPGQVNHLAVSMQGTQILLVINNQIADSFEDAHLSAGVAGLGVNLPEKGDDVTLIFTNFTVRAPKH